MSSTGPTHPRSHYPLVICAIVVMLVVPAPAPVVTLLGDTMVNVHVTRGKAPSWGTGNCPNGKSMGCIEGKNCQGNAIGPPSVCGHLFYELVR